jgi:hypothetical protein
MFYKHGVVAAVFAAGALLGTPPRITA